MSKGIIYYTDNYRMMDKPIVPLVQRFIKKAGLPIVSVSLKPIDFGENIVLKRKKRGMYTLTLQIITALKRSTAEYVFFCEHDVLYHKTHFDFTPPRDDTYYYNTNVYRWRFHNDLVITHSDIKSLSGLCCNRKLALRHFKRYRKVLDERGLPKNSPGQPRWLRRLGYEPGCCRRGLPSELFDTWKSKLPNVDIRHRFCYTNRKTSLASCRRKPEDWTELTIDDIPGWNIRKLLGKDLYVGGKLNNKIN